MTKRSTLFGINVRDIFYGTIVAIIGAILTAIQQALTTEPVVFNWRNIAYVGVASGISYIIKNFFSNSQGKFAKTDSTVAGPGGGSTPPDGTTGLPK